MQDRLDDILQARPLPDDLIAPGHLPAKRLRRLISYPDFRQKAARIELGKHAGVDRIGLDLRMSDDAHLLWVSDHDLLDLRCDHRSDRGCVTGRFDDDHVLLRKLLCESLEKRPAHVDTPQSLILRMDFELPQILFSPRFADRESSFSGMALHCSSDGSMLYRRSLY